MGAVLTVLPFWKVVLLKEAIGLPRQEAAPMVPSCSTEVLLKEAPELVVEKMEAPGLAGVLGAAFRGRYVSEYQAALVSAAEK